MEEIDTQQGGESLTLDQAAAAYAKATAEPVSNDHGEPEEQDESDTQADDELQADEQDAGEETEGETADEEHPDDSENEEPDSEQGRFVADNAKVRLADGTVTSVHELKRGFLREADYTRKTQETSARLKDTETREAHIKASQEQLDQRLEYTAALVKSIIGTPPDPTLADPNSPNYDPAKYQAEEVRYRSWAQHLTYIESELDRSTKERHTKTETESKEKVGREWAAALEKMPELKDPKKLDSFGKDTVKFGTEYGYTPQELANIHHDHRQLLVMKDAIAWRKLQAAKANPPKKVENRPPVVKGGKRLNPQEHQARAVSDATAKLQSTGRLDDAVALLLATQQRK
jgi:hypothetical protein